MPFLVGFLGSAGIIVFLWVAWPAILLGIVGVKVIDVAKTPSSQRMRYVSESIAINETAKMVRLVSFRQNGPTIVAVINNGSSDRIYNMILSCSGGPSFRDHSGWLDAGKTVTREFYLRDGGAHTDCILGYDVDIDQAARTRGHMDSSRSYGDNLTASASSTTKGTIVTVGGTITNYSEDSVSFARLKCSFTTDGVDVDHLADIPVAINPKATSNIHSSFNMSDVPSSNIFCKVMNVVNGGDTFR